VTPPKEGAPAASVSLVAGQYGHAVTAAVNVRASRSALKARLFWQKTKKAKRLLVGSLTQAPLAKGLHSFTVNLDRKAVALLEKLGKLKLTLEVTVTPPQGAATVAIKKVTLKP
jgi:hypothetical protein